MYGWTSERAISELAIGEADRVFYRSMFDAWSKIRKKASDSFSSGKADGMVAKPL